MWTNQRRFENETRWKAKNNVRYKNATYNKRGNTHKYRQAKISAAYRKGIGLSRVMSVTRVCGTGISGTGISLGSRNSKNRTGKRNSLPLQIKFLKKKIHASKIKLEQWNRQIKSWPIKFKNLMMVYVCWCHIWAARDKILKHFQRKQK